MWREDIVCRSVALIGFSEVVESLGGDPTALMEAAGIDTATLNYDDSFISWVSFCDVLEMAARELNAPDLGLQWAVSLSSDFSNKGPLAILVMFSPDVRTFISSWMQYTRVHTNGNWVEIFENDTEGHVRIVLHSSPIALGTRQLSEHILAIFSRMSHEYLKPSVRKPLEVWFQHSAPKGKTLHDEVFGCPVKFNADHTAIYLRREIMDIKLGASFKFTRKIVDEYLARRIQSSPFQKLSITTLVAQSLPAIVGVGNSDVNSVAALLGMNTKKLQRLLSDEGTNYSDILDEVRKDMACRRLRESDIAIGRLAGLLDYTSMIAFRNACKRWTGMSPREYRKASRQVVDDS